MPDWSPLTVFHLLLNRVAGCTLSWPCGPALLVFAVLLDFSFGVPVISGTAVGCAIPVVKYFGAFGTFSTRLGLFSVGGQIHPVDVTLTVSPSKISRRLPDCTMDAMAESEAGCPIGARLQFFICC